MMSTAWAAPWASACMSSASLIVNPPKPSPSRSTPPMTVRDRVAGRVGSPVSAGTATWADITSRAPAAMAARNGANSWPSRSLGTPLHDTERVVGVLGQRAQTREVLRRGGHAGRLEAADHRRPMTADRARVVAERADAERRVGRLGGEIDGRGVDDVDAQRAGLAPDGRPDPLGQPFVVDRAEGHVAGELGRLGTQGVELAAFLVGGDEERAAPTANRRRPPPAATPRSTPAPAPAASR